MAKKIIISGGGTGGHIYPAIAIANALRKKDPSIEILFVGAEGKMEMEKVPRAGYTIVGLPIVGIKRELSLSNMLFPFKLAGSLLKAWSVVRKFKPDVAVGVGGFASGPLLIMASLLKIPTLIQEQNSYAGITNKWLARKAKVICVAYPGMEAFFPPEKIRLLGNPVRTDILDVQTKKGQGLTHFGFDPSHKIVFVMGGSLGARTINESIYNGLGKLVAAGYQVLWQTGKLFIDKANEQIRTLNLESKVRAFDFIYEMDLAYAVADLVVSRAGALSVSELCLARKPAVLVPFPAAAEDHQTKNAMSLVSQDAAVLVKDMHASHVLIDTVLRLMDDSARQAELAQNLASLAKPEAADAIAEEILKL